MKQIFVYFLVLNGIVCLAQENGVSWDYPVKPGSEEWREFKSRPEMVQACRIPDTVLQNISTHDLMELCLNYPLLHDIMFYNIPQMGFVSVSESFNGFAEFFRRDDAGLALLKKYKTINPDKVKEKSTGASRGFFIANLSLLEIVLAQDAIIGNLSIDEKKELIEEAHSKFISKIQLAENYGLLGISSTPLIMVRLMKMDVFSAIEELELKNHSLASYRETGISYDFCMMQDIDEMACEYLKLK